MSTPKSIAPVEETPPNNANKIRAAMPSNSVMGGFAGGTGFGVFAVWLLNAYVFSEPMPAEVAAAAGGFFSMVATAIWEKLT